jgi:hypothetical protein
VGQVLDALLGAVGAVNVHTAVGVCDRSLFQLRNSASIYVVRYQGEMECFILALLLPEIPNSEQRVRKPISQAYP